MTENQKTQDQATAQAVDLNTQVRQINPFIDERKKEKLTQKEMAKKIGISLNKVRLAEHGYMNLETACAFCIAYKEYEIRQLSIQKRVTKNA